MTGHPFLTMDGQAVFKLAVSVLDSVGREVLAAAGLSVADVDWLIPHQANIRIMQGTAKKLGLPLEKMVVTVDQHGNTSAASIPLALDVAVRRSREQVQGLVPHLRLAARRAHVDADAAAGAVVGRHLHGELQPRQVAAAPVLRLEALGRVGQLLAGKIEVIGRLSYDQPGQPTVLFRPAGDRPRISQIQFTGNETLPPTQLFNTFSGVAVGKEYSEETVRRLLDLNIRPLYEARGRLRVAFSNIAAEPSKETDVVGVAVNITVNEGPEFKLGHVRYTGAASRLAKELDDVAKTLFAPE